jgi:hypothetical protein
MSKSKAYEPRNKSKQNPTQYEREAVEYGLPGVKVRKEKRQKNPRNFSYEEDPDE